MPSLLGTKKNKQSNCRPRRSRQLWAIPSLVCMFNVPPDAKKNWRAFCPFSERKTSPRAAPLAPRRGPGEQRNAKKKTERHPNLVCVFTVPPDAKKWASVLSFVGTKNVTARCSPGPPKGTRGATRTQKKNVSCPKQCQLDSDYIGMVLP